ncbi:MAG: Gfo/Idh/MocA family protein [Thainema sp.]
MNDFSFPIRVGLVGTGYAAKLRADALQSEPRAKLVAVTSHRYEQALEFSHTYGIRAVHPWQDLCASADVDLIMIATVNRDHGAIARAALEADKHVVVEYPLALDVAIAEEIIQLAEQRQRFLHVEHIELLGGLHQALLKNLSEIGQPFHVHYRTINPQRPAPRKWTYQRDLFGFPLMGALSRLHRMTNAFGPVATVSAQIRYRDLSNAEAGAFDACLCTAQLQFQSGVLAEVIYGKGETLWQKARYLEVQGTAGALVFDNDQGTLVQTDSTVPLEVGGRRGLFAKDTGYVFDALTQNKPMYVTPAESLYALRVAEAAQLAAMEQTVVQL